MKKHFFS